MGGRRQEEKKHQVPSPLLWQGFPLRGSRGEHSTEEVIPPSRYPSPNHGPCPHPLNFLSAEQEMDFSVISLLLGFYVR